MTRTQKTKPVAVIISDIHFNIQTLEVATEALHLAVDKANELKVNLIITGDLHDTKANVRAECMNAIIKTLGDLTHNAIILRGNHDSINEKSDTHALGFLNESDVVIDYFTEWEGNWYIPYQHDLPHFKNYLSLVPKGSTVFMHQGVQDSNAGHYIQDKSAVPQSWLKPYRVISGHYHTRQSLGNIDYIGNPYTLTYGEANDPEKGFQVLHDDGSLEFIPTNLRKHIIIDLNIEDYWHKIECAKEDILWVKVRGPSEYISKVTKEHIANTCDITQNFRLDLIPTTATTTVGGEVADNTPQNEILDNLINSLSNTSSDKKERLKALWKNLI